MRALALKPLHARTADLLDVAEPLGPGILVRTLAVGICGTDREILNGEYGWAPPGRDHLILGHESLGEVLESQPGSLLAKGDLVVGIVRQPDPVPCPACACGEFDMCRNGKYKEHGIKELDGFCRERFRLEGERLVRVPTNLRETGVLVEPASVVAKAWDHIEHIGSRTRSWCPQRVLVTGAGPVGLLASLLTRQRGLELHVYDRNQGGTKPGLIEDLGGQYHSSGLEELSSKANVVIECTGAAPVIATVMSNNERSGVVCLTGLSSGAHHIKQDFTELNKGMVLENDVIFGTVNANRGHYETAASALAQADPGWLRRLITRRVPLNAWQDALQAKEGDIKTVIDFTL